MAKQSYDTRALVRAVYPLILAEGDNPTSDRIKQRIREEHPELAKDGFNPSDATINDEVRKIRRELGASMTRAAALPGLPEEIAGPAGEFVHRLLEILRGQANEELAAARQELESERVALQQEMAAARAQALEAAQRLEDATRRFEIDATRLRGEIALANDRRAGVEAERAELQQQLASAAASLAEKTEQLARTLAEKEADAQRFDGQIRLAEERYQGLEKAKLNELDQARQARERAEVDLNKAQGELRTEREGTVRLKSEIQDASRQVAELTGEIRALREREAEKDRRIGEQDQQVRDAAIEAGQLRERLQAMTDALPSQTQQAIVVERNRVRGVIAFKATNVPAAQKELLMDLLSSLFDEGNGGPRGSGA